MAPRTHCLTIDPLNTRCNKYEKILQAIVFFYFKIQIGIPPVFRSRSLINFNEQQRTILLSISSEQQSLVFITVNNY